MHILDFLKYTTENSITVGGYTSVGISKDFYGPATPTADKMTDGGSENSYTHHTYSQASMLNFMAIDDVDFLEKSIKKHWIDVTRGANYGEYIGFADTNPYHMVYAYLLENTRMFQIFDKLITMFRQDEKLTKAGLEGVTNTNINQLLLNTEQLFFKDFGSNSVNANIVSALRPSSDATRRNAYHRLLGLGLNWNDYRNNAPVVFHKAEHSNKSLIAKLELFLRGFWAAYSNASNTAGVNNTDMFNLKMVVKDLRLQLMSRRSNDAVFSAANYGRYHLSHEEYSSVIFAAWLKYLILPGSPLAEYLRCDANTPGDVLINIGNRIGLPAHTKSDALFDMADDIANFMRSVEMSFYETGTILEDVIKAHTSGGNASYLPIQEKLLNILNNWEITTGRSMKDTIVVSRNGINKVAMAN